MKHLYKTEADPDVMERLLLLVMKVEGDEMILARIAKELHRSRTWASDCLAKYKKEGVEGLKDIHKIHKSSGRDPIQTTSRNSCLVPVWLPTASAEFMVLEQCWNISKKDLLVLTNYQ
ncbi:MAG: helix-turn-helix domain-containing protein [Nitrososphaeraceae archaeon]